MNYILSSSWEKVIIKFYLTNEEEIIKLENHNFASPNVAFVSENGHQW